MNHTPLDFDQLQRIYKVKDILNNDLVFFLIGITITNLFIAVFTISIVLNNL